MIKGWRYLEKECVLLWGLMGKWGGEKTLTLGPEMESGEAESPSRAVAVGEGEKWVPPPRGGGILHPSTERRQPLQRNA